MMMSRSGLSLGTEYSPAVSHGGVRGLWARWSSTRTSAALWMFPSGGGAVRPPSVVT
jgi:hypothetical protein